MIDKIQMSEEDIKLRFITPAITRTWDISQITMETKITDGKISLKGNLVHREKPKYADYILYLNNSTPIAVDDIEHPVCPTHVGVYLRH